MTMRHIKTLQSLPFLDGASPEVVERLAQQAVEKTFRPGEIILAEGSTGREMYLVVEGLVEVVKGDGTDELLLGKRGPGDLFGEMALIEDRPRFATVRALEPTRLLVLSEPGMREALSRQPELLYATVRMLSARLRESDLKMIEDLQRKNEELARAYRELEAAQAALVEKERLERELELARGIQQGILPDICPKMPGFACAARYRAAYHVGGDFYDLIPLDGRRVGLVMADVSGKGMAAALFMALARSLIRAEAQRMASPQETLLRVNRLLLDMSRASMFVTVFYGVLDLAHGKLCYARAGHDYPLLFRSSAGKSQFLGGAGIVLGMLDTIELEEVEVDLDTGDLLVLYTDGITEANTPEGELFGPERLREVIQSAGSQSAQGVCDLLFRQVDLFQQGGDQHDDMAVLVAKVETSD
jgi:serine phosphatase RsbU (regulator of sigma subunit)